MTAVPTPHPRGKNRNRGTVRGWRQCLADRVHPLRYHGDDGNAQIDHQGGPSANRVSLKIVDLIGAVGLRLFSRAALPGRIDHL